MPPPSRRRREVSCRGNRSGSRAGRARKPALPPSAGPMTQSQSPLVEIAPETHDVELDIAYATPRNVTGQPVYSRPGCYLHRTAEEKLRRAVDLARPLGYRL